MTLFYIGNTEINSSSWEEIILSLITYTDRIWIPSYVDFYENLDEKKLQHLKKTFNELKENKIISSWDFEFNISKNQNSVNKIITYGEHIDLAEKIDTMFAKAEDNIEFNKMKSGIERTSKFIDYRNDLWNMSIADLCNANGFIARKKENLNFLIDKSARYKKIYFDKMFHKFQIANLWTLNTEQIIRLRKLIHKTKIDLDRLIKNKLIHIDNLETVFSEDINKRYKEYQEVVNDIIKLNFGKGRIAKDVQNAIINIYGIFLWPISFMPLFTESVNNYFHRRNNSFVAYISELKHVTKNQ